MCPKAAGSRSQAPIPGAGSRGFACGLQARYHEAMGMEA